MSLLSIVNHVQRRSRLPVTTEVISSSDPNVKTLLALADEAGEELARRHPWEALVKEHTFTAVAAETQTDTPIPTDLDERYIMGTVFNRTQTRKVLGPLSAVEWQNEKAVTTSIMTDAYRIRGGLWLSIPTPEAGDTYAYEYVSDNWCQSSGSVGQNAWAADSDTGVISERLMRSGLIWRWQQRNNFDYSEAFNTYEREVVVAMMRDGGRRTLNFSNDQSNAFLVRAPVVPDGSWNL